MFRRPSSAPAACTATAMTEIRHRLRAELLLHRERLKPRFQFVNEIKQSYHTKAKSATYQELRRVIFGLQLFTEKSIAIHMAITSTQYALSVLEF
jgi:hypothetical protein